MKKERHLITGRNAKIALIVMVILIVVLNYINYRRDRANPKSDHIHKHQIDFPSFQTTDYLGRTVSTSTFKDKNVFFQFINPASIDDRELFQQVYSNFKDERLEIVVFTSNPEKFHKTFRIESGNVYIVGNDLSQIYRAFLTQVDGGAFYLYDSDGKKVAQGTSGHGYENGPKLPLNKLIWNESFDIEEFVRLSDSIANMYWFRQLDRIMTTDNKEVFIFFLSVRLCDQCGGGAIIRRLRELHTAYGDSVGIYAISFTQYSDADFNAIKSQAKISFPFIKADTGLVDAWDTLIKRFNSKSLDNIVILADKSGHVKSLLYYNCKCFESFFDFAGTAIKERLK